MIPCCAKAYGIIRLTLCCWCCCC